MFAHPKHNRALSDHISLTQVSVERQLVENCDIPNDLLKTSQRFVIILEL